MELGVPIDVDGWLTYFNCFASRTGVGAASV